MKMTRAGQGAIRQALAVLQTIISHRSAAVIVQPQVKSKVAPTDKKVAFRTSKEYHIKTISSRTIIFILLQVFRAACLARAGTQMLDLHLARPRTRFSTGRTHHVRPILRWIIHVLDTPNTCYHYLKRIHRPTHSKSTLLILSKENASC